MSVVREQSVATFGGRGDVERAGGVRCFRETPSDVGFDMFSCVGLASVGDASSSADESNETRDASVKIGEIVVAFFRGESRRP